MMGAVGAAFGRNMPLETIPPDEPNAVLVCRELMDRTHFIPARSLNILAAAWIQFQVHDWVAHERRKLGEQDLVVPIPEGFPDWVSTHGGDEVARDAHRRQHPAPARQGPLGLRQHHVALVGRLRGLRLERRARARAARGRAHPARRRLPADQRQGLRGHGLQRELVDGPLRDAHALRPRAQHPRRRAPARLSALRRRAHLPDRAPDRLGADRQDPHHRVDPGHPRHRGARGRHEDQLVRPAVRRLADPARHLADRRPRAPGHPEDVPRPPRRALLADRGVRDRLPDAPADPGRLHLLRLRHRGRAGARGLPRHPGAAGRRPDPADRPARLALLVRHRPSRRDHAAQLPQVAAALRARRRDHRPLGRRHHAHARPPGAALQRLPPRAAHARGQALGGPDARPRDQPALPPRSTATSRRSTPSSAFSARTRPRASASRTPRSASSS